MSQTNTDWILDRRTYHELIDCDPRVDIVRQSLTHHARVGLRVFGVGRVHKQQRIVWVRIFWLLCEHQTRSTCADKADGTCQSVFVWLARYLTFLMQNALDIASYVGGGGNGGCCFRREPAASPCHRFAVFSSGVA